MKRTGAIGTQSRSLISLPLSGMTNRHLPPLLPCLHDLRAVRQTPSSPPLPCLHEFRAVEQRDELLRGLAGVAAGADDHQPGVLEPKL